MCAFLCNALTVLAKNSGFGKQMPSDNILFSRTNLPYVLNIEMGRRVRYRSGMTSGLAQRMRLRSSGFRRILRPNTFFNWKSLLPAVFIMQVPKHRSRSSPAPILQIYRLNHAAASTQLHAIGGRHAKIITGRANKRAYSVESSSQSISSNPFLWKRGNCLVVIQM